MIRVLVGCQNQRCAAEISCHLDMVRMLVGQPICKECYEGWIAYNEDGEPDKAWNDLPPVRMADLSE